MITLDPLTLPDVQALLASIDSGDDSALPALADALEEQSDARAVGLRSVGRRMPRRQYLESGELPSWVWYRARKGAALGTPGRFDILAWSAFDRLPHPAANYVCQIGIDKIRPYPSRSAAYLALAEALTR